MDATNVIPGPAVCLITPVSLEHQDILGRTIEKIAREKAGIIKNGSLVATVQNQARATRVIIKIAREKNATLWLSDRDFRFQNEFGGFYWQGPALKKRFRFSQLPYFQIANAALALAGIQMLKTHSVRLDVSAVEKSFSAMHWPGRIEIVRHDPLVVMDGAHNPAAALALFDSLQDIYPKKKWIILNGFLKDKDYTAFAKILRPITLLSIVSEPPSERAETGARVAKAWEKAGVRNFWIKDWRKALDLSLNVSRKAKMPLLVTGSLYLIGICRRLLIGAKGLDQI